MSEHIIGARLIVLGIAFFAAVTVVKAKIGWSFDNYDKEDKD